MEKDKVIELVKRGKTDEREKQVMSKGFHVSMIATISAMLLIMILRSSKDILFTQDLLFILVVQMSTLSIYQYIKLKNSIYLITFLIAMIAVVLSLINVLTEYGYF